LYESVPRFPSRRTFGSGKAFSPRQQLTQETTRDPFSAPPLALDKRHSRSPCSPLEFLARNAVELRGMAVRRISWMGRLLKHRIGYGVVIPPETRVDAGAFSEDEFPVFCTQCEYLLRGLPDGRCPECGKAFDRGRLLVEQYAIEGGARPWKRTRWWAWRLCITGFSIQIVTSFTLWALASWNLLGLNGLQASLGYAMGLMVIAVILLFASMVLMIRMAVAAGDKGKIVFDAINQDGPGMMEAKAYTKRLWAGWYVVMVGIVGYGVYNFYWKSKGIRYYQQQPMELVFAIGGVVSLGVFVLVVHTIFKHMRAWE